MKSNLIQDTATRNAVRELEKMAERINRIQQLPADATTEQIVKVINQITDSVKQK